MTGISKNIQIGANKFHYVAYGEGPQLLIAFHGFYQQASTFEHLFNALSASYTIISIDLPHHGDTVFKDKHWQIVDVIALIKTILTEYKQDKISLLGYSIGGRIILSVIPELESYIQNLYLCAADGFYMDKYYLLATRTIIGKKIFNTAIHQRHSLIKIAKLLNVLKIIPERTFRFAKKNIDNTDVFQTVVAAWPTLSRLTPKLKSIEQILSQHRIRCIIFTGKYDAVIRPKAAVTFASITSTQHVMMDTGHDFTHPTIQKQIAKHILE